MKQLTHEINLNMTQPNNFEYVYAMQSDYDSEIVVATLYDGNTLYTIDANQAVLNGVTENGNTIVYNNVTIDSDKHRISFPLTKEMLFESGDTRFVVSFFDTSNNQRKSAFPFIIKSVSDAEGTLPVSVLKKISEYVAEAAASAQEAKESAKNAKDSATNAKTSELNAKGSENNAKKYATEAKSYAVGGTGTRKNEDIQNTQYYYNVIKELFDQHLEQILYYTDYASFEKDYNAEKITPRTLVLIAEGGESDNGNATNPYCVNVNLANNMTRVDTSGSLKQYVKGSKTIDEIIINANSGYYFPDDYECIGTVNGIVIARNNENQLTISGSPTKNTEITLIAPTQKTQKAAPTGLKNGETKILNTTTEMEYATSSDSDIWESCTSGSTIVNEGSYYVRFKATDTELPSQTTFIEIYKILTPITDLKVESLENDKAVLSCTKPDNYDFIDLTTYVVRSDGTLIENNSGAFKSTDIKNTNTITVDNVVTDFEYKFKVQYMKDGHFSEDSNYASKKVESRKIYLYKNGDECVDITGGWEAKGCYIKNSNNISAEFTVQNTISQAFRVGNWIKTKKSLLSYFIQNKVKDIHIDYDINYNFYGAESYVPTKAIVIGFLGNINGDKTKFNGIFSLCKTNQETTMYPAGYIPTQYCNNKFETYDKYRDTLQGGKNIEKTAYTMFNTQNEIIEDGGVAIHSFDSQSTQFIKTTISINIYSIYFII